MKKFLKAALIVLLFVVTAIGVAGCDNVTRIRVKTENMPRSVYVQGQDLDLSAGKLTVTRKEGSEEIPLDSDEVVVSGYDKNKLGTQELTVEYGKQTTTFDVEVVERVVVQNYEPSYFVGEEFNKEKGRLVITRDDGTSFNVNMSDESVSIEGFDSVAAASPLTVTARYTGNNMNYTGTFNVNVYAISDTQFTRPNKSDYESHEQELDLAGGYITFRGNNGALTRYITLTQTMVSGFNPGEATEANRTEPLEQTITVNYAGNSYSFTIHIRYSDVSYFIDKSADMRKIEWTEQTVPDEEQGALAVELMELYLDMDYDDMSLISTESSSAVARVAAVYAYNQWEKAMSEYSKTLVPQQGTLLLSPNGTYDDAKAAYDALQDKEGEVWKLGNALNDLIFYFGTEVLYTTEEGDVTVADYTANFCQNSRLDTILPAINYLLNCYTALQSVPKDWQPEQLNNYADAIDTAHQTVTSSSYATVGNRALFTVLSSWREKDDYFDILYTYYFKKEGRTKEDEAKIFAMQDLHLPQPLETLYNNIRTAMTYLSYALQTYTVASDSTPFMLTYREIETQISDIIEDEDEMTLTLFASLRFSGLLSQNGTPVSTSFSALFSYLTTTQYGYYYQNGGCLEEDAFTELWTEYLNIVEKMVDEGGEDYVKGEEFDTDAQKLWEDFADLTPARQYQFICSLNNFYTQGYPQLAFSDAYSYFMVILAQYAAKVLPEEAQPVFINLLIAIEAYSRQCNTQGATTLFKQQMTAVLAAYNALTDKEAINKVCQTILSRYVQIADLYEDDGSLKEAETPDLESDSLAEWKDTIEEMLAAVRLGNFAYGMIMEEGSIAYLPVLLAAYEKAEDLSETLLAEDSEELNKIYLYKPFELFSNASMTLDYGLYYLRTLKVRILTNTSVASALGSSYLIWDLYESSDLKEFMVRTYSPLYSYLNREANEDGTLQKAEYVAEDIKAMMESYRALSPAQQNLYLMIDAGGLYTTVVIDYYTQVLSTDGQQALLDLLNLERALMVYAIEPEGSMMNDKGETVTYAELVESRHATATKSYEALTEETDKTALQELYEALEEDYNNRNVSSEMPDPDESEEGREGTLQAA